MSNKSFAPNHVLPSDGTTFEPPPHIQMSRVSPATSAKPHPVTTTLPQFRVVDANHVPTIGQRLECVARPPGDASRCSAERRLAVIEPGRRRPPAGPPWHRHRTCGRRRDRGRRRRAERTDVEPSRWLWSHWTE